MSEEQIIEKVTAVVVERMETCEKGIVAERSDGLAAIALVAPNCLVCAVMIAPGIIIDQNLN